ncbi:pyridoxamine 5'-phosphate oxidase [Comamonas testosteroni]|uniref:Pyridoxamine 5'-phosphate oxidase n=1 Tax=Comamonas testosteroni TaxID=285 RepID=A0A373F6C6_COMTE|nr:pyridoxamine 5'-phosphate oxidase [Comamonas testosteroni]RGE39706.1 pyridoxamine 5'-phosphate oxidase [Comamonas testosteroni]
MPHEPRLQQSLRELLDRQRTAALAVQPIADFSNASQLPAPALSFVPWAWCAEFSCIVIHVSGLASHTSAMQQHPAISLMMVAAEQPGQGVHALERVSIQGVASTPPQESVLWQALKASYLQRFPEAEAMTMLGDFRFMCITPNSGRHIAGFGAAREVSATELGQAMQPSTAST